MGNSISAATGIDSAQRYWDEGLETQSRASWERLKLDLLQRHLRHAYAGSPYYRTTWDAAGVHPDQVKSLDDLRRFPFLDKATLRERQMAVQPFGDLMAVPERDVVYISASSGSTGVPTASPFMRRTRLPGTPTLKTTRGKRLSMHSEMAVESMTLRPRLRISM